MDRRKFLSAYVRTNKRGKIVPGSLTLLRKQPRTPGFKQVVLPGVYNCVCEATDCVSNLYIQENFSTDVGARYFEGGGMLRPQFAPVNNALDSSCNLYSLSWSGQFNLDDPYNPVPRDNRIVCALKKTDKDGTIVWQKWFTFINQYNQTYGASGQRLLVDAAGNSYVLMDFYMVKFDKDGNSVWAKPYLSGYYDNDLYFNGFEDMAFTTSGKIAVTGFAGKQDTTDVKSPGTLVAIVDPATGNVLTEKAFFLPSSSTYGVPTGPYTLGVDSLGHIYGQLIVSNPDWGTILKKMDDNLNTIWTKITDFSSSSWYSDMDSTAIKTDSQGNIYLNAYGSDLYKLDPDGNTLWTNYSQYLGSDYYKPGMAIDTNGNVYVTGWSTVPTYIAKFNTNGGFEWYYTVSDLNPDHLSGDLQNWAGLNINGQVLLGGFNFLYQYPPDGSSYSTWYNNQDFKIGLENLGGSTIGDHQFTDNSGNVTMVNDSNIVYTDVDTTEFSGPILVNNPDYSLLEQFADVYTITTFNI